MRYVSVCSACSSDQERTQYCFECLELSRQCSASDYVSVSICSNCAQRHVRGALLRHFGWGVCPALCLVPVALHLYNSAIDNQILGVLLAGLVGCYYVFLLGRERAWDFVRVLVSRIGREKEVELFAEDIAKRKLASDSNSGYSYQYGSLLRAKLGVIVLNRLDPSKTPAWTRYF